MSRKKLRDTDDDLQIINAITKKGKTDVYTAGECLQHVGFESM